MPDQAESITPPLAISAGLLGSASTWAFNALIELLQASYPGEQICAFFGNDILDRDEEALRSAAASVIKCHAPSAALRTLIRIARLPVVVTVREPCDSVVSLMQRFGLEFDEAFDRVALSAKTLTELAGDPTALVLRYEQNFFVGGNGIRAMAQHLGLRPSPAVVRHIARHLSPSAIRRMLEATAEADRVAGAEWRRTRQWHANHLGDGRIGKYRDLLSYEQAADIQRATRPFRDRFGYADTGWRQRLQAGSQAASPP